MERKNAQAAPMLNAYPDSVGSRLGDMVRFLQKPELRGVFQSFYILPSLFNTDLDRGFSVVDYSLSDEYASREDLKQLEELGIDLKLDFILNHASVLSPQFQDILKNGDESPYRDFFIRYLTAAFAIPCISSGPASEPSRSDANTPGNKAPAHLCVPSD